MTSQRIISRQEWGARPPKRTPRPLVMPTPELWLHHTAGAIMADDPDDIVSPEDLTRIRSIQAFHQSKWDDIGYNLLLDPDGNVFEGRGVGVQGAHVKGRNHLSHGIAVMGDFRTQPVPPELDDSLAHLVRHGINRGWWRYPITGGHRDAPGAATTCPGHLAEIIPRVNELATRSPLDAIVERLTDTLTRLKGLR